MAPYQLKTHTAQYQPCTLFPNHSDLHVWHQALGSIINLILTIPQLHNFSNYIPPQHPLFASQHLDPNPPQYLTVLTTRRLFQPQGQHGTSTQGDTWFFSHVLSHLSTVTYSSERNGAECYSCIGSLEECKGTDIPTAHCRGQENHQCVEIFRQWLPGKWFEKVPYF